MLSFLLDPTIEETDTGTIQEFLFTNLKRICFFFCFVDKIKIENKREEEEEK